LPLPVTYLEEGFLDAVPTRQRILIALPFDCGRAYGRKNSSLRRSGVS